MSGSCSCSNAKKVRIFRCVFFLAHTILVNIDSRFNPSRPMNAYLRKWNVDFVMMPRVTDRASTGIS